MTHLVGRYRSEAILLGPVRCQGCDEAVVWLHDGTRHLGWLHADGLLRCSCRGASSQADRRRWRESKRRRKAAA